MSDFLRASGAEASLESVLSTGELNARPSRPPDYKTENRTLLSIAQHMADSPRTILQKLVEVALEVCRAGSAGVSLLNKEGSEFYWPAIAGVWKPHTGGGTPRHFGPCGVVLDRNAVQLFTHPERYYPYLVPVSPAIEEALLVPFHVEGKAVGTVWVVAHDPARKFDAEDIRLLESFSRFAAAAYPLWAAMDVKEQQSQSLRDINERLLVSSLHQHELTEQAQRAEAALRDSERSLGLELAATQRLQEISTQLIREDNVEALYQEILDAAMAIMHSDTASIQIVDESEDALRMLAFRGFDSGFGQTFALSRPEARTSCSVARQAGRRVVVPDVETCSFMAGTPALEDLRKSGIRAVQSTPLVSRGGRVLGMISTHWRDPHPPAESDLHLMDVLARQAADLMERSQAERELRDSEEKYRTLFNSMDEGFCIIEKVKGEVGDPLDFRYVEANLAFASQSGVSGVAGKTIRQAFPGESEEWFETYDTILRTGEPIRFERGLVTQGRVLELYAFRVDGEVDGRVAVIFKDITERKRSENVLRESEEAARLGKLTLDTALAASDTGTFRWNPYTGEFLGVDDHFKQLWGFAPHESIRFTQDVVSRVHPGDVEAVALGIDRCRDGSDLDMEFRVVHPDGSVHWLLDRAKSEHDAQGRPTFLIGACTDVTRRKRAEETVRESEERFRTLVSVITDVPWTTDAEGRFAVLQPAWAAYTGQTWEEMRDFGWANALHPDDRARVPELWELSRRECKLYESQGRFWHAATETYRYFEARATPLFNQDGSVREWVGTYTDVEEQKRFEATLQSLNADLKQFSFATSHDLQEPLRMVTSYTQLLAKQYKGRLDQRADEFIAFAVEGAQRMEALLRDLREYWSVNERKIERLIPVDCNRVLEKALNYLEISIRESGAAVTQDSLPTVMAEVVPLTLLFQNLIGNAIKYHRPEIPPRIHVSAQRGAAEWRISVTDNGIGIQAKHLETIFAPFKRLHGREIAGTGIGLAMCHKIVERYRGRIWVESKYGQGSTFHFTIPAQGGES